MNLFVNLCSDIADIDATKAELLPKLTNSAAIFEKWPPFFKQLRLGP